jgi:hypothetical protein
MIGTDAHVGFRVTDVAHHFTDDVLQIDGGLRRDFAGDDAQAGGDQSFASNAAHRVLGQHCVEHAVRDLVGELVGVAHADGFARKQIFSRCHG